MIKKSNILKVSKTGKIGIAQRFIRKTGRWRVQKIRFVVGQTKSTKKNKKARKPSYKFKLTFGSALDVDHPKGEYSSSAQLTARYEIEDLLDSQILSVVNFPRKQIGHSMSDCLIAGVQCHGNEAKTTTTLKASKPVLNGTMVTVNLGEIELLLKNNRDLTWEEFEQEQFRLGTVNGKEVDFGAFGKKEAFGNIPEDGTQALFWVHEDSCVALSAGKDIFLTATKTSGNGWRLA